MAGEGPNAGITRMKLMVPPVIQVIVSAFAMHLIVIPFPQLDFTFVYQKLVSGALVAGGLIITFVAVYDFRKAKTTVNPTTPSQANTLIIGRLYRVSRNPMYLGFLMILSGWTFGLGNLAAIGILMLFIWYMTVFQIKPEEQALKDRFGADYEAYCKKVRRWI